MPPLTDPLVQAQFFAVLAKGIEAAELLADPDFGDHTARTHNRHRLIGELNGHTSRFTKARRMAMSGMSDLELRDWFAGQALAGILANTQYPLQGSGEPLDQFAGRVTDLAYRLAEAMMKQAKRLKKDPSAPW